MSGIYQHYTWAGRWSTVYQECKYCKRLIEDSKSALEYHIRKYHPGKKKP